MVAELLMRAVVTWISDREGQGVFTFRA